MVSIRSVLSHMTRASRDLRISSSWAGVKEDGWLPNSYQNRSPTRTLLNWVAMMQAKVGPSKLPGRDRSDTPPDHKSMSCGDLVTLNKIFLNCLKQLEVFVRPTWEPLSSGRLSHCSWIPGDPPRNQLETIRSTCGMPCNRAGQLRGSFAS